MKENDTNQRLNIKYRIGVTSYKLEVSHTNGIEQKRGYKNQTGRQKGKSDSVEYPLCERNIDGAIDLLEDCVKARARYLPTQT
jgi:hypothetical protein